MARCHLLGMVTFLPLVVSEVLLVPLAKLVCERLHLRLMTFLFGVSLLNHGLKLFRELNFDILKLSCLLL